MRQSLLIQWSLSQKAYALLVKHMEVAIVEEVTHTIAHLIPNSQDRRPEWVRGCPR